MLKADATTETINRNVLFRQEECYPIYFAAETEDNYL